MTRGRQKINNYTQTSKSSSSCEPFNVPERCSLTQSQNNRKPSCPGWIERVIKSHQKPEYGYSPRYGRCGGRRKVSGYCDARQGS